MAEIEVPVQVIAHRYACDECGEEMKATGMMLASHPPQWSHQCKNGHKINLPKHYPSVAHVIGFLHPEDGT